MYKTFNILTQCKPNENNFSALLTTVCELANTECVVREWLHDVILGYRDSAAAHCSRSVVCCGTVGFSFTFFYLLLRSVKEVSSMVSERANKKTKQKPTRNLPCTLRRETNCSQKREQTLLQG